MWIEILVDLNGLGFELVTLCMESVDWNATPAKQDAQGAVTLCMGSVDWNKTINKWISVTFLSLSVWRVWIEILLQVTGQSVNDVTLCMESVDWNIL